MISRKKIIVIGIVFLLSLVVFSSFLNNSNALQNDNDLTTTLHAHLDSTSAEVDSDIMETGTYTYYQSPSLDLGSFSHDLTKIDITNIQYQNENTTLINNFIDEVWKQGNNSISYNSIPAYQISSGLDTRLTLFLNYTSNNYTKEEVLHDTIDSLGWSLFNISSKTFTTLRDNITDDSYVSSGSPTTNYGSSADLRVGYYLSYPTYETYISDPSSSYGYSKLNITNAVLYYYLYYIDWPYSKFDFYKTSYFDESTLTWNNKPSSTGSVLASVFTSTGHEGWFSVSLGSNISYIVIKRNPSYQQDCKIRSSDYATISVRPYIIDTISKEYQGNGYKFIQTNKTETLQLRSSVYNQTRMSNGDYINFTFQTTTAKEVRVKLLNNGVQVQDLVLLSAGNTNFNSQTKSVFISSDLVFNQIEIYGEFDNIKYFKLYDVKAMGWKGEDFINSIYVKDFNYNILGINKTETFNLTKYNKNINYTENDGIYYYFYIDSTSFNYYYHNTSLVIPNQKINVYVDLIEEMELNITLFFNYSILLWKVPSEVNLKINGVDVIDATDNSGYVFFDTFPTSLVITADVIILFRLSIRSDFSFSFDLDVVSRTYIRKEFELLSNHQIYFERIDLSTNLDLKKIYLNSIDLGCSNPNILSPEIFMNQGNIYSLDVILSDDIYIPLQYFYNDLGTGTSNLYISGLTNKYSFNSVNKYSGISLVLPNNFFPVFADLNFSNIEYQEYYVSNFSNNINSYDYESTQETEENVDWSFDYNLTSKNGTKDGESGGSGYKDVYYQYFDSITGEMTHIYFPAYNSTYTVAGQLVENNILPKEFQQEAWLSWALTYNSTCTTSSFASGTLISQLNNYQNTYSPATGEFQILNGTKVAFGSLSSIDGAYVNMRSTQQNASVVPTSYTFLNGSLVSSGSLWSTNGAYTNFRSNQQNSSVVPTSYTFLNGSLVSSGSLWSMNGAYTNLKSKAGVTGGAQDTGYLTAGTVVEDSSFGTATWDNEDNAKTSNNAYATSVAVYAADSHYLVASNFGAVVPAGSTVNGIIAQIERKAGTASKVTDIVVSLMKDGVIGGDNKKEANYWATSDETITYGASNDLWGLSWSPAQINSANFGIALSYEGSTFYTGTQSIDVMTLKVYYTPVGSQATLNATSTLQLTKPKNSQISSVQLNYAQKINTTITAGIRTMYIWNYITSAWVAVNTTISTANYYEMVYAMTSQHYSSAGQVQLKWIITRTDSIDAFSLYMDKMVVRMNFTCVLNFTSTLQIIKPKDSKIDSVRLNYAQKTNLTCTTKVFYIWDFIGGVWDIVNSTISSTNFYEMVFTLESSQYNSTNHIKLKWILYRATSLMTSQTMFSLYIDKMVFRMNFTCALNFTSTFQFSKLSIDSINWIRLNYGQKTNLTCTSKVMYIWNFGRSGWDIINTTISSSNYYDMLFTMNSSHYNSTYHIKLKWVLYRGANLMTSQTMFSLYIDKLVLTVNTTRTGGQPYSNITKTINYAFLNYFDTNYNYLKIYNITVSFRYKYTGYTAYGQKAYFRKDTTSLTLQTDAVWRTYAYLFQFDSASLSSFILGFNITNGKLELTNMNYTIVFCSLNTTSRTILYQYYKLDPMLSLSYLQATRGIWYLNFSMVFTQSNFNAKYWNQVNYSQLLYRVGITTESGIIYYSFNTNTSLTQLVSINLTQIIINSGKLQIWDFYIEFYLSGNNSRLIIDNLYLWNYDHDFYEVYAVWITDSLVYVGQTITVYWKASDEYPKCVIFTQKIDGLTTKQIYNITLLNNTLQSQTITNYTAGVCDLNLTFYDEFDNWQRWNITYIIHATVSVSTAYKNPIYTIRTENVSVYIKSDSLIQSIHYDNSTAYLLKSASYPISQIEFNISLYFAIATVYNISVNVLTTYGDYFRCNISNLCAIESIARIDVFNLMSRYYQDNTLNVSMLLLDYGNNPIYQVIQYNIVDPNDVMVQNGGILGNVGTIVLGFDVFYDVGFYHLNASFSGANTYTDGWKYMSFELMPITQYFTNGTGINLSINGTSITGDSIRVLSSSIFVLNHLDNASFDLDITFELYHSESVSYNEYVDYSFIFQASSQFTELTIDNATLLNSPINFTSYYFNDLLSINYILINSTLTISDLIGDVFLDDNDFSFELRYTQFSKTSVQLTVNPTTDDTGIEFEEYLYANRTFSYWYFANSKEINSISLDHIRTGTIISTFTVNGSLYYFIESSLNGDVFEATIDYNPEYNVSFSYTTTGVTSDLTIKFKSALPISNVDLIVDLSTVNLWMENWSNGAIQSNTSLKLTVPNVNFTSAYQYLTIHGTSSIPHCSFASFESQDIVSLGQEVTYYGFIEYSTYSQSWLLDGIRSNWTLDGLRYWNAIITIRKSDGYFRCSGFDDSITESYLKFKTNPVDSIRETDDGNGNLVFIVDCNLPINMAWLTFSIPTNSRYRLVSQIENITSIKNVLGNDMFFFLMSDLKQGTNRIDVKYTIYTVSNIWILLVILGIFSAGIVVLYWYGERKKFKESLKTLTGKQRERFLETQYAKGGILTQIYRNTKELLRKKSPEEKERIKKKKEREKHLKEIEKQKILI